MAAIRGTAQTRERGMLTATTVSNLFSVGVVSPLMSNFGLVSRGVSCERCSRGMLMSESVWLAGLEEVWLKAESASSRVQ